MFNKQKSNYEIAALRRNNLTNSKSKIKCFDFVVCRKSKHNKRFVIEKLGSISGRNFYINIFRLVFWLQFNVSFNTKSQIIINKFINIVSKFK